MSVVVTNIERVSAELRDAYGAVGAATAHEAAGRQGAMAPHMRPIYRPTHAVGTAVTCEVAPGDNWMLHVAVEQCADGDMLVVVPTGPCEDGYFGDLLATSLQARGVRGLVIEAGVRDIADLTQMAFPVWSKAVSIQGTVKGTLANVNMPVVCAGVRVEPGDLIIADDDGVVCIPKNDAAGVLEKAQRRMAGEEEKRARLAAGELGLDMYDMRGKLTQKGLRHIAQKDLQKNQE